MSLDVENPYKVVLNGIWPEEVAAKSDEELEVFGDIFSSGVDGTRFGFDENVVLSLEPAEVSHSHSGRQIVYKDQNCVVRVT